MSIERIKMLERDVEKYRKDLQYCEVREMDLLAHVNRLTAENATMKEEVNFYKKNIDAVNSKFELAYKMTEKKGFFSNFRKWFK